MRKAVRALKLQHPGRYTLPNLVRRAILAWLCAALLEYVLLPFDLRNLTGVDSLAAMSLLRLVLVAFFVFTGLNVLPQYYPAQSLERLALCAVFGMYAAVCMGSSYHWAFLNLSLVIVGILLVYCRKGWDDSPEISYVKQKENPAFWIVTGVLALAFIVFVSAWTVFRIWCYWTPTFDFGLFSQMFHNMRTTGLPMTTLERDGLLSHFQVHVSPVYYLMLPFYCIVPRPETLQVLQAVVLASSAIPLWKIGTRKNLPGLLKALLCALLLVYPAFSGGTSYDIHENCFLTPLILWLLYGMEARNLTIISISALLTLCVKEDAPVYVAVAAIYGLARSLLRPEGNVKKERITYAALLCGSVVWFLGATGYLTAFGDGVMNSRYENFLYDGTDSLIVVVKSVFLNPMKTLYECVDKEKLTFLSQTMFTLLCLPLLTRRYERYLLLIPYMLVNLMSDYTYQHDIFFQYTFGSTAFLFYLVVLNLADLKEYWIQLAAAAGALVVASSVFCSTVLPKAMMMPKMYQDYKGYYTSVTDTLSAVPQDASVAASTFYTTMLSQRQVIYDVKYCSRAHLLEVEYVVLQVGSGTDYVNYAVNGQNGYENLVKLLQENGFALYQATGGHTTIWHREQK